MKETAMRRRTLLGGLAALAAIPPARAQDPGLVEAARKEGSLTWFNGYMADTTAQLMVERFQASYPGVRLNTIRSTSQVAFQRLRQDQQAGLHNCDVYSSSDISHFADLSREKRLMSYTPANAAKLDPALAGKDLWLDGQYYPALVSVMAIAFNNRRVTEDESPKSWAELMDAKWKGKLTLGHPGFSGYAGTWAVLMQQTFGKDVFDRLAALDPLVGRSANDAVTQLNAGERVVGTSPAYVAIESARKGNPISVNYPTDGSLLMVSPAAAMADAPHPNAAKLFMEWLLGPENSTILVGAGGFRLNTDTPGAPDVPALASIPTKRPTVAEIVRGIPQVTEAWRDALGG